MAAPPSRTDAPPEMGDPPAEVPEPPATVALNARDAVQEVLGADSSSSALNPRTLHTTDVHQAKPKMMIPTFRRRTPALPVSTLRPGLSHHQGLMKLPNPEAPVEPVEACEDAAEDMISDDPENGDHSTMDRQLQCM